MRFLAVIPARGGSKGIPKKNIKKMNGKPLIEYTIDVAKEVFEHSDICLSTDSDEIAAVVIKAGLDVRFRRPLHLASDTAGMQEVLLHALSDYESNSMPYDAIVLLQPTSPLRRALHVKEAMALYTNNIDMVVSVTATRSNPYYVLYEEEPKGYLVQSKKGNFVRRQDCPNVWELNGAIYVINRRKLQSSKISDFDKKIKYVMSPQDSIDIDSSDDWDIAEMFLKKRSIGN